MSSTPPSKEIDNFSLMLGGPLFQLFIRAHLGTNALGLVKRRIAVIVLFTWLPLLLLSFWPDTGSGNGIKVPFLYDIEVHVRFLITLPLMLVAELVVHQRFKPLVLQFVRRGIVPDHALPKFEAIIGSALRLRNSVLIEVLLIIWVFTIAHYLWSSQIALETNTWYSMLVDKQRQLSPAGYWYSYVSISVFQFIFCRWYFRLFIWARFLWQVAHIELHLVPTHPDRAGGLGFLANSVYALAPLLLAHGTLLSGTLANHIFYEGHKLLDFKPEIVVFVVFVLLITLGPLCAFVQPLTDAKRQGLREYGALASQYVMEFERKWLRDPPPQDEPLVGSGDIQSLNDLAGSFDVVKEMRAFPFDKTVALRTIIITLLPVAPLALTLISLEEMLNRLLGILL